MQANNDDITALPLQIKQWLALAARYHQLGALDDAARLIENMLQAGHDILPAKLFLADIYHQQHRHRDIIELLGHSADSAALMRSADAAAALGDIKAADSFWQQILTQDNHAQSWFDYGNFLQQTKQPTAALQAYEQAAQLSLDPLYHLRYAEQLQQLGDINKATAMLAHLAAAWPDSPDCLAAYYALQIEQGDARLIAPRLGDALSRFPDHLRLLNLQLVCHIRQAFFDQAQLAAEKLYALAPDYVPGLVNYALVLQKTGHPWMALQMAERALELAANDDRAANIAALALRDLGRSSEAIRYQQLAIDLNPQDAGHYCNLGNLLQDIGDFPAAIAAFRAALARDPNYADAHSNIIFLMGFSPEYSLAEGQAERRRWAATYAARYYPATPPSFVPHQRIRIGYVGADFQEHAAAFVFAPLLTHFDRQNFDVYVYSLSRTHDSRTAAFLQSVTMFRDMRGQNPEFIAQIIRNDEIDILVDLGGHTAGGALLVFAQRPAPIQCSGFGHLLGTGLATMDYLFSDKVLIQPSEENLFAERIVHVQAPQFLTPPEPSPPIEASAFMQKGHITFGTLNRLSKINPAIVALWSRILQAIPSSQLLLKDVLLEDATQQQRLQKAFAAHGIAPQRLLLMGRSNRYDHLAAASNIDVALDPFPQGGGMTSLETLWMGVPLVTLAGSTIPSRVSASLLTCLGLADLIAHDTDSYYRIAVALAHDTARLVDLRSSLRPMMQASVLSDPAAFAQDIEQHYRVLYQRHRPAESV